MTTQKLMDFAKVYKLAQKIVENRQNSNKKNKRKANKSIKEDIKKFKRLNFETQQLFRKTDDYFESNALREDHEEIYSLNQDIDAIDYETRYLERRVEMLEESACEEKILKNITLAAPQVMEEQNFSPESKKEDASSTLMRLKHEIDFRNELLSRIEKKEKELNEVKAETMKVHNSYSEFPNILKKMTDLSKKLESSLGLEKTS